MDSYKTEIEYFYCQECEGKHNANYLEVCDICDALCCLNCIDICTCAMVVCNYCDITEHPVDGCLDTPMPDVPVRS